MRVLSLNERRLIEKVATDGPLARTDLSRALGLTGATVTRMVAELEPLGLFDEWPDRKGRGGQPKRLLRLKARQFYAAGLTFSRRSVELVVLDLIGQVVGRRSVRPCADSPRVLALTSLESLAEIATQHGIAPEKIVGIGCAMPGNFGPHSFKAHGIFADFDSPAVVAEFKDTFAQAVWIENDGKSAALGEYVYGRQPDDGRALFLIHVGHGVGGGAVIDGVPFRGVNGNACLAGFLFPYGQPRPSAFDLLETLTQAGQRLDDFGDLNPILADNRVVDDWVARAGEQLSSAVLAATAFIDPSMVVIGGRLPPVLNQRLVARIHETARPGPSRGLSLAPVRAAQLGPEGSAIGAACLPLFDIFFGGTAGNNYLDGRRS